MGGLCPQSPPENKEAVIAIQGGGVYALPMLGQARVLLDEAGYVPLAFAGNSGGAILATLLWSSLAPSRIEAAFTNLLRKDKNAFSNLLMPIRQDERALTLGELRRLYNRAQSLLPLPSGFCNKINWYRNARALVDDASVIWRNRGAFSGDQFTRFIDGLVKEGLGRQDLQRPVQFRDVPRDQSRPPLLLTITNVSRGTLEVIDSTDPTYENVSVAQAVRASAGFPGFFHPIDLPGVAGGRCFVDGGMIANFPLWAFSASFRERLDGRSGYGWLASRPWLPIGLRVRDDVTQEPIDTSSPFSYFRRLGLIAAGLARNDLEDRLVAATLSNQMIIDQSASDLPTNPRTGDPIDALDVDAITTTNIREIVETGATAARNELSRSRRVEVYDRACGPSVLVELKKLLEQCRHALVCPKSDLGLRTNIFIPDKIYMRMYFGVGMTGYSDDGLQFDTLTQGLTGFSYQTRSPAICNLRIIKELALNPDPARRPYNMDRRQQAVIDPNRSWLISYPIFDPAERQVLRVPASGLPATWVPAMYRWSADHIGPVLGVLNVDAGWDYEQLGLKPSPDDHINDPRVRGVIDAVAQTSVTVARLLVGLH